MTRTKGRWRQGLLEAPPLWLIKGFPCFFGGGVPFQQLRELFHQLVKLLPFAFAVLNVRAVQSADPSTSQSKLAALLPLDDLQLLKLSIATLAQNISGKWIHVCADFYAFC